MKKIQEILNKKRNILVTGGSGFIGSCLIRKLLNSTDNKIYNLDKMGYASDNQSIDECLKKNNAYERYKHFKVDLYNFNDVTNVIDHSNPDLIIHLAAESHVDKSIKNPSNFINSNIIGTFNLLQAVLIHYESLTKSRKSNFRFHHVSTDEVFGTLGSKGFFNESTPYDPRSPYSASKASSDHLVRSWFNTYELPISITNCSNNYGPWQFPEKLIPLTIKNALLNKKIPLYGDGENIRDWLFVDDHIDAILLAANLGNIGDSYCVGGKEERRNLEVVNTVCTYLNNQLKPEKPFNQLITKVSDRPGHDFRYAIDSKKIESFLGWKPSFDFDEGIKYTVNWYLKNKKRLLKN